MAKLIVHRELATPLATAAITGHDRGGFYGLENTPRRMMSDALRMKIPERTGRGDAGHIRRDVGWAFGGGQY